MGNSLFAPRKLTPGENRRTRVTCGAIAGCLLLGLPLLLCVVYSVVDLGSIGPWVLISGFVNFGALPILALHCAEGLAANRVLNAIVLALAFIAGIMCAGIGMNIFMGLTSVFGLGSKGTY